MLERLRRFGSGVASFVETLAAGLKGLVGLVWTHKWKILAWSLVLFGLAVILWFTAAVLYALLYYSYMPIVHTEIPLHFEFSDRALPTVNVNRSQAFPPFYPGQSYKIAIELDLPESPENVAAGMFMVRLFFFSKANDLVFTSSRPCILHYKSRLLRWLWTLFYSVPLLLGFTEEKQTQELVLLEDYVDDYSRPTTFLQVELSKPGLQLYSAKLHIDAQLGFVRSILYRWFFTSAFVGISTLFFIEWFVVLELWAVVWVLTRQGTVAPHAEGLAGPRDLDLLPGPRDTHDDHDDHDDHDGHDGHDGSASESEGASTHEHEQENEHDQSEFESQSETESRQETSIPSQSESESENAIGLRRRRRTDVDAGVDEDEEFFEDTDRRLAARESELEDTLDDRQYLSASDSGSEPN